MYTCTYVLCIITYARRCKLRNTCTRTERWLMKRKPLTKIPQPQVSLGGSLSTLKLVMTSECKADPGCLSWMIHEHP